MKYKKGDLIYDEYEGSYGIVIELATRRHHRHVADRRAHVGITYYSLRSRQAIKLNAVEVISRIFRTSPSEAESEV